MIHNNQRLLKSMILQTDDQNVVGAMVEYMHKRHIPLYDNRNGKGEHPLCYSARIGKTWSFKYLLEREKNTNTLRNVIDSALQCRNRRASTFCLIKLIEAGAPYHHFKDDNGNLILPIQYALKSAKTSDSNDEESKEEESTVPDESETPPDTPPETEADKEEEPVPPTPPTSPSNKD